MRNANYFLFLYPGRKLYGLQKAICLMLLVTEVLQLTNTVIFNHQCLRTCLLCYTQICIH